MTPKKSPTAKYTGELLRPLVPPRIGLLMNEAQIAEKYAEIELERWKRMAILFDAHGVNQGDWQSLCFALAIAHVPGFKMAKGRAGAKTKWQDYDRAMLVLAVEQTGLSVTEATELLAKQEPWKSMVSHARGAKTLHDEYYRADQRMVRMARVAQAFDALSEEEKEAARKLSGGY